MTFLTLLIVLLMERFWHTAAGVRHWGWLNRYSDWVATVTAKAPFNKQFANYFIVVVSFVCLVLIIQGLLLPLTYYAWYYIFNFLVLLYCFGPENFYKSFAAEPSSIDIYDEAMKANRMVFGVFFWFAILGTFGAVLYRVTERMSKNEFVQSVLDVLDWIPVRLLAVTFGLVSYFITVFPVWLKYLFFSPTENQVLLTECTKASLAEDQNTVHFLALVDRSLIVWLVVLALIVLL